MTKVQKNSENNRSTEQENLRKGKRELSKIKVSNVILPTIIGLGVVAYMIFSEADIESFKEIRITGETIFWLFISILFMFGRDIGYIIRLMIFAEDKIPLKEAIRAIMLWEFTSSITPSAVGGTSVAVIYVHKAGLSVGKSTTAVLLTSFFDELYFILMFPILIMLIGTSSLFGVGSEISSNIMNSLLTIAIIGYTLKLTFLMLVTYGLFISPKGIKWLIEKVFNLPILRKWRDEATRAAEDIVQSSEELKSKGAMFWVKSFLATALSWSSRYMVVNTILLAFFDVNDHLLLFGKQLVMWIMMLVIPTPGGSGFSEYLFSEYLGEFIPVASLAIFMALIWRLITYYPYLIIGAIILPRWLKRSFKGTQK